MEADISNKTIVVLVVLTVVISVLSTLLMMNEVKNNVKINQRTAPALSEETSNPNVQQGEVKVNILPKSKTASSSTGYVTLNVVK